LKIGQYLMNLCLKYYWFVFFRTRCIPGAVILLCIGSLPYKHKIVVAGNHELSFDDKFLQHKSIIRVRFDARAVCEYLCSRNIMKMKDVLVNCTYLEDAETTVFGLRVYGSPWYAMILFVIYASVVLLTVRFMLVCNLAEWLVSAVFSADEDS